MCPMPLTGELDLMWVSHTFPQGMLAAIIFVGVEAGSAGARAGAGCEVGLPLCSVAPDALLGMGSGPL